MGNPLKMPSRHNHSLAAVKELRNDSCDHGFIFMNVKPSEEKKCEFERLMEFQVLMTSTRRINLGTESQESFNCLNLLIHFIENASNFGTKCYIEQAWEEDKLLLPIHYLSFFYYF